MTLRVQEDRNKKKKKTNKISFVADSKQLRLFIAYYAAFHKAVSKYFFAFLSRRLESYLNKSW